MGLFDFVKDTVKKIAGVVDNPLTRGVAALTGQTQSLTVAQAVAGNKKALKSAGLAPTIGSSSAPSGAIMASTPPFVGTYGQLAPISMPGTGSSALTTVQRAAATGVPGIVNPMTGYRGGSRRLVPKLDRYTGTVLWVPAPRRMNYMNYRAAKRAARRLSGAMKLLHKIESLAPRRRSSGKVAFKKRRR